MARNTGPDKATRELVSERDGWRCLRCGESYDPWPGFQLHHRRPRGSGGSTADDVNSPANIVTLHSQCHDWAESRRAHARADGFLVPQGMDPATVPLRRFDGVWVYLGHDGLTYEQPSLLDAFWAGWSAHDEYKRVGAGTGVNFGRQAFERLIPAPADMKTFLDEVEARQRGEAS
jgi:hypothetical protein